MDIKKLLIICICLIILCILVVLGAIIIKYFVPSAEAVYTTMFAVGVTGMVLYGMYLAYILAEIYYRKNGRHYRR